MVRVQMENTRAADTLRAMSDDRYASFDYSRLIQWDQRLQREWPFLESILAAAPARSVLDLGAGTGEHARFLASRGFDVTGVDSSPAMLEKSRAAAAGVAGVAFVAGDLRDLAGSVTGAFGAALCLGNVLPHLSEPDDLHRFASGLSGRLLPGAPVVLQMINYDRIEAKGERALPLTFLPDPEDPASTIVFLRSMELRPDGSVVFMPTTLRQTPAADPPLTILSSRRVEIRGWRHADVVSALGEAGFERAEAWGSFARDPFEGTESRDLIVTAWRMA